MTKNLQYRSGNRRLIIGKFVKKSRTTGSSVHQIFSEDLVTRMAMAICVIQLLTAQ